jgi:hypothetical protein
VAIALDGSTPARASATAALTIATASFTAPSSAVLVACVSANSTPAGNPTLAVSDSGGLTWAPNGQRSQSEGGGSTGGTCAIFSAVTASSTSRTVTATASGTGTANGISVKVYVWTGVDTTTPTGATAEGASQTNNTTTTAYVSTVNNSRGVACGTEWNELGVPTSTDTGDGADVTGQIAVLSCFKAADTATSGTSVTFNLDAAGTGTPDWTYVAVELLPGAGGPAPIPWAPRAQPNLRDPGESYFTQARRSLPGLLGSALLENELLGGATTAQRAVAYPRATWLRQPPVTTSQAAAAVAFDPTLAGSKVARIAPATHADRRLVPQQPPRFAPVDVVTQVGTGATNAWWSDDPAVAYIAATMPRRSDPSLLAPPATPADPLLFPPATARRMPVTHADRREVPAQRTGTVPLDNLTSIGTGTTNAWWSVDDWAHFGPAQRRQIGVPDDTVTVGTGAMVAWWGVDDTAAYLGQRRPTQMPAAAPVLFDPLLAAWLPLWLAWNRAATHADRRLVPQQRPYISDPSTYPQPAPDADPLLLAAAVGGDLWRRVNLPAFADRREVPQQPPRRTLYFDAGPGVPPLTLAWGAGGAYWHLYNRPSRLRPFWPQQRPSLVIECDCTTHRPYTGTTARPGGGTTARPSTGITARPCVCS